MLVLSLILCIFGFVYDQIFCMLSLIINFCIIIPLISNFKHIKSNTTYNSNVKLLALNIIIIVMNIVGLLF